jgi:predicted nucleic acid-binding protein
MASRVASSLPRKVREPSAKYLLHEAGTPFTFVDTNIFFYALDPSDARKNGVATDRIQSLWSEGTGRISEQVLKEYYAAVQRKGATTDILLKVREEIRMLMQWTPVGTDIALLDKAWSLMDDIRYSFWDSLILAAALRQRCTVLLTEDMQHGQVVDGLRIVNPFLDDPIST